MYNRPTNYYGGGNVPRGTMAGELGRRGGMSVREAGETMRELGKRDRDLYGRRMFRMANGGAMPPMDPGMIAPPMDPGMIAPPMDPGMIAPPMDPAQQIASLPPELVNLAAQEFAGASSDLLEEGVGGAVNQEVDRTLQNLNAAGDFTGIMNAVWDSDKTVDEYRLELASVVGPEDAARTPDSVLALVQPTLQLAQLDEGIGALMQEELAEIGDMGGGIATLSAKSAAADGMAAETAGLVDAVGGMNQGPMPMDPALMMAMADPSMAGMPVMDETVSEEMVNIPPVMGV
jgi:hypothetical protein